jgi:molybdopterin molybdotransferase
MSAEPDVSELLTVEQAIAILDATPIAPSVVRVPLAEARGLYLAQDLHADRDYPPFDKSLMDGYAARSSDLAAQNVALSVAGEIAAGQQARTSLAANHAYAIMTGAPIPPGADTVIPVEDTTRAGDTVTVRRAPTEPGRFIARRGHDAAAGQLLLRRGARLEAAQLAVAATVGAHILAVHPRPTVAVLSTGDEIVDPTVMPAGSQIRNSNGPMITALLCRLGYDATDLGIAPDQPAWIRSMIEEALDHHDALFVSGGMSMGTHDHVPRILKEMGFTLRITRLRIKPGKPFVFATRQSTESAMTKFVFGLPGNPVSGFACTLRLASRLLARLAGGQPQENWLTGALSRPLPANGPREFYQPAAVAQTAAGTIVTPLAWKGSADLFTLAIANALLVRPENQPALEPGAAVRTLPF